MCKDTDLTDRIFTAWKAGDQKELARLRKEIPEGYTMCIVEPGNVHPTIVMVRDDEIESSVAGFQLRSDGTTSQKRTLITDHQSR